ncbi:Uu.00g137450.m01.CDS01 [Anthostomella pinea]|uniref:Uu.00g137450.m01.CDS01 n=1 Tax=Anthostomella pinea TaxID=933095 RepID=A0AAI8YL46_9PEZI|nr:Uu.00g137450.m01.CDS01 [Anthostomella pinea]
MQSVLRCGQCNKPFDKQSTLTRHGYYCRSRKAGSINRPRSCIACARGKAGCDHRRPECSRCMSKAIECHYSVSTPRATGPATPHGDDMPAERGTVAPSSGPDPPGTGNSREEASDGTDMLLSDALVIPDSGFAGFGGESGEYPAWDDPGIGLVDFLNAQTGQHFLSPGSPFAAHHPMTPSSGQTLRVQPGMSPSNFSIPATPSSAVRSLIQRPKMQAGAQRIANLIFHTLKSYPLMMLHHNNLPPFVHPSLLSSVGEDVHMEPLTNCISLVHMISSRVQGSRRLFWKNVRHECERLSEEHETLTKWELLAAMQALSIYVLIRLDEGETDHNNFDFLLVKAVTVIAQDLTSSDVTCHTQCALCNNGLETSWKEWIFRESRRRMAVVYRVVNMLVYFQPAAMCELPEDFLLAPLPARRQLWEAGDEFMWKAESQRGPGIQVSFGLASEGELVKLDESRLSCSDAWLAKQSDGARTPSRSIASWEEWCAGIDGFGGLVLLAASLIV